jgi:hypothetical protein
MNVTSDTPRSAGSGPASKLLATGSRVVKAQEVFASSVRQLTTLEH